MRRAINVTSAIVLTFLAVSATAQACGASRTAHARGERTSGQRGALVIGDSTMLLATPLLGQRRLQANARGCRQFAQGMSLVRARRRAGALPHLVVMALGTNGEVSGGALEALLKLIGPRRVLALVTPRNHAATQAAMRRMARRRPHRVLLIDWRRYSDGRPGWLSGDGLHPTHRGALELARYIARRAAPVTKPAVGEVRLPADISATKGCGQQHRGAERYVVRVVSGRSRMTCARARSLVARPPLAGTRGWSWWDWRPVAGPWLEVYRRQDRNVVVATAPVPTGADADRRGATAGAPRT